MQLNFPTPIEKSVSLGSVKPGSIIRIIDSSNSARSLAKVQVEPWSNLFMVFTGKDERAKHAVGYTNLMSMDGEHICRRQNDRQVVVHEVVRHEYSGSKLSSIESLRNGSVIVYGISEGGFVKLEPIKRREFLYVRTKETPEITGRIPFVSLEGSMIFLDSDRMVISVEDFALNFK